MHSSLLARTFRTLIALFLIFAGGQGASAAEKVRIAGLTWPGYGWWHIIQAKNLAPDLEITYQAIEDPFQSFSLMTSGQLEIVSSTAEFAPIGASQNMPVRIVTYGNLSYGTDQLVLRPEIESAAELKGKKVAVMVGGLPQIMMGIWLEKNGVPFDSVEYVNVIMDQAAAAMIGGTVGAAELWEPFATQTFKAIPNAKKVASTRDPEWAANALIADAHFMNTDWIAQHRDTALKALKAMYDAIAYWKKNPTEANQIIADGMKMSVPDVELVLGKDGSGTDAGLYPYTFIEAAQFCGAAPGDPPFGQKNGQMVDHFRLTNEWWVKFGVVPENYPPERGIDCSLLKDLYDSGYRG
ncbi:MAG: ABC transporter substrate-binding protein [Rhodospirillales bacterium]|nr:ABC transporter substrate-binding protein [Rhodospirillales bacterium]